MSEGGGARELAAIRLDLESRDDEVRRLATESLLSFPIAISLPVLLEALGDSSWRVRKVAVDQLADSIELPEVIEVLIEALGDGSNSGRRNSALEALVSGGPRVVSAAIDGLASDDVDVRKQLIDALGGIGDGIAREPLLECMDDPDANVRGAAADALGVIGGAGVAECLQRHCADESEDPLVRVSALRALAALRVAVPPERLGGVLANPILRPHAYAVLAGCPGEAAREILIKGLQQRGRSSRLAAMGALLKQVVVADPQEVETLVEDIRAAVATQPEFVVHASDMLGEADLAGQLCLVQFLSLVGDARAVLPILQASCDPALGALGLPELAIFGETATHEIDAGWPGLGPAARIAACRVMAEVGGEAAARRLIQALDDPDPCLRMAAADALAARHVESALPALIRRVDATGIDSDAESEEERAELTDALAAFADPAKAGCEFAERTIESLVRALDGGSEPVRVAIAQVIGRVGRPEDAALVARLMKDPSARVRREAVVAVSRFDAGEVSEALRLALADESTTVRIAAVRALAGARSAAVIADLERLTTDEDPDVCAAALRAAGRLATETRDPEALSSVFALIRGLQSPSAVAAIGAVETLDAIASAEAGRLALPFLARTESEVLQLAVSCVGRHAERSVLAELIPLISHEAWEVRTVAIQSLGERGYAAAATAIMRRQEHERHELVREAILRALRRLEA